MKLIPVSLINRCYIERIIVCISGPCWSSWHNFNGSESHSDNDVLFVYDLVKTSGDGLRRNVGEGDYVYGIVPDFLWMECY